MAPSEQNAYFFGNDVVESPENPIETLGCKGANLVEMVQLELPVPPGFIISTDACRAYYQGGQTLTPAFQKEIRAYLTRLETTIGRTFGDPNSPLLLSVRSGASVSMPGMMDTVLNLGLNTETVEGLAIMTGDRRFALDCYRRFIQMYASVVMGMKADILEQLFERMKQREGISEDAALNEIHLKELVGLYKQNVWQRAGMEFPESVEDQLWGAISGVFESWNNKRAHEYRKLYNIKHTLGTAVTIQTMVFGNLGGQSATGVALTRNPSTGERHFFGEYLQNAQGEDVVAGVRTPSAISNKDWIEGDPPPLETEMPEIFQELQEVVQKLEGHFCDLQDIEFTIEDGTLWMLQTRSGKRTAGAAIRIAVDMVNEGLISKKEAVSRIDPHQLDQLLHPTFDPASKEAARKEGRVIARGLPASPGAEVGPIVLDSHTAVDWSARGTPGILVRQETSPDDILGMSKAAALLTVRGGMTSHAAVVARGMGRCCVVGCRELRIDAENRCVFVGSKKLSQGDILSIDGSTGEVFLGQIDTKVPSLGDDYETLMSWVDDFAKLDVRANAHTPQEARVAQEYGAKGIGLCRTEHMFFSEEKTTVVREMILAEDAGERRKALSRIAPMQKADFKDIFRQMNGQPITMRLFDTPLHVFLPTKSHEIKAISDDIGVPVAVVQRRIEKMREVNPMLGHRGCRLGVTYPEIYEMQVRAIIEAACELVRDEQFHITPEIMIPLVGIPKELDLLKEICRAAADQTMQEYNIELKILIGTMIELPRAVLEAEELAAHADFFCFGTNDLTQTVLGISRDDAASFLPLYIDLGLLRGDPFVVLDPCVERLMELGIARGRKVKPSLPIGICGVHANDPNTIRFCHRAGLDYISCSPYRVPVARLAAAHAAIEEDDATKENE